MDTAHSEFHIFINKFYQLWQAGVTANLHCETHAGMAWVQVRAQLGRAPAPADRRPQAQRRPGLRRRRGPAHQRRVERRAAARTAAAAAEQAAAYEAVTEEVANPVTEQVAEIEILAEEAMETKEETETVAEEAAATVAEEVIDTAAKEATETVTEEVTEDVTKEVAETEEETKRKGSPLLNTAKHRKFDNVTIRKKKKIFISRSGAVGVLIPSPQKTEEEEEEEDKDGDKEDDDNDDNNDVEQRATPRQCRKLMSDLGPCGRAYSSAAMDLAIQRTSAGTNCNLCNVM